VAAERTPVDKLRTDTSLLLDIKGELSVLSTHVSTILEAQRDASAGREKIYAKLEKVDDRLEQAERLAERAKLPRSGARFHRDLAQRPLLMSNLTLPASRIRSNRA
jgi:hypothetical protein